MSSHLRANLWLLLFTVVICSVLYPLTLLGVALLFPDNAAGSLVHDEKGNLVGSRLIAREFKGDEYFQARPSHAGSNGYDAAASGASNWGASNYRLRDRVARQLGPIVRYGPKAAKPNELVGPDAEKWFQADSFGGKPGIVAQWAERHPNLAEDWFRATGDAVKERWGKETTAESFVAQWQQDFPSLYTEWRRHGSEADVSSTKDLAAGFFRAFSGKHPGHYPYLADEKVKDAPKRKKLYAVKAAKEIDDDQNEVQKVFFDMWRQEHPDVDLLEVPGDMVTASASGLDPHITLKNAEYQARWRVADAWVDKIVNDGKLQADEARRKAIWDKVHDRIVTFVKDRAAPPLGGLAGVPLVNVVEVNVALPAEMNKLAATLR